MSYNVDFNKLDELPRVLVPDRVYNNILTGKQTVLISVTIPNKTWGVGMVFRISSIWYPSSETYLQIVALNAKVLSNLTLEDAQSVLLDSVDLLQERLILLGAKPDKAVFITGVKFFSPQIIGCKE